MGKRCSNFKRFERDLYDTPAAAVGPLLPHLGLAMRFIEPCLGRGCLACHLAAEGHVCVGSYDLPTDARNHRYCTEGAGCFFTNPPWTREGLHPIIVNLSDQLPTWLLLDFDWLATQQAAPFLSRLRKVVAIGRVRWIPDSPYDGMDNAAWLLFSHPSDWPPVFVGRTPRASKERAQ
jgi:hypothetical protein